MTALELVNRLEDCFTGEPLNYEGEPEVLVSEELYRDVCGFLTRISHLGY